MDSLPSVGIVTPKPADQVLVVFVMMRRLNTLMLFLVVIGVLKVCGICVVLSTVVKAISAVNEPCG